MRMESGKQFSNIKQAKNINKQQIQEEILLQETQSQVQKCTSHTFHKNHSFSSENYLRRDEQNQVSQIFDQYIQKLKDENSNSKFQFNESKEKNFMQKIIIQNSQELTFQIDSQIVYQQSSCQKYAPYLKDILILILGLIILFIVFKILIPSTSPISKGSNKLDESYYKVKVNEFYPKARNGNDGQQIKKQQYKNFIKNDQKVVDQVLQSNKQNQSKNEKQSKNSINDQEQNKKYFYEEQMAKYSFSALAQRLQQTLKFWMLTGKNITESQELQEYAQAEKDYFQKKYQISKYGEIQICVLVLSYMNEANDRYKRNLDSIFQQQYKNYKVYYVDDNSGDKTAELVEKYIKDRKLESKMKLYKNKQKKGKSSNQFYIGQKNCKPGSVMVVVDGDDQLIGRQVFKFLSAAYQSINLYYIYTQNVVINEKNKTIYQGYSDPLQQTTIINTSYRKGDMPSHLRTWMSDLFLDIRKEDLMIDGEFPQIGEDVGSSFQLMQKAGTKVRFINESIYRYVMDTGHNDYSISRQKQIQVQNYYRKLPKFRIYDKNITYNMNQLNYSYQNVIKNQSKNKNK